MRLLAADVDGTIVAPGAPGSPVSSRVVAAFRSAHRAGVCTALVTGRPLRWLGTVVASLGWVDALVVANGALTYLLPGGAVDGTEQLVARRTISPDDVVDWAVRLRAAVPAVAFGLERPAGFGAEPGFAAVPGTPGLTVASLPELLEQDSTVVKLLAKVPRATLDGDRPGDVLLALARDALAGRASPVHSDSRGGLVEVGPPGTDKATGLAEVAGRLGVARADVVAFGDMPNDVPMLRWSGAGYAMGDGHDEALAAADHVAAPCTEDGVALAVETLLADLAGPVATGAVP